MGHATRTVASPVGRLVLMASGAGLAAVLWAGEDLRRVRLAAAAGNGAAVLDQAEAELAEYFAGSPRGFTVGLDLVGTGFQLAVWRALLTIPFGTTRSYAALARQIGRPGASRAVGAANGRNPVSMIVPCHRLVGADGGLRGFAGGLEAKRWLLAMERGGELPPMAAGSIGL